jgi:hypothetical protein
LDESDVRVADFERLPLVAVPAFVLVDQRGVVIRQTAGASDETARAAFVADLLAVVTN